MKLVSLNGLKLQNTDDSRLQNRIKYFFGFYFLANVIAVFIHIYLSSYFNYKLTESMSEITQDQWCKIPSQGLGVHCFSDFYYALPYVNLPHPWAAGVNSTTPTMPPFGLYIFKPWSFLVEQFPNSNFILMIYLALLFISVLIPALHLFISNRISGITFICMIGISIIAAPFIVGMDRGNFMLFCVPLLYFFYLGYLDGNQKMLLIASALLILLKPHMIFLGLIFLADRDWRQFFKWLSVMVSTSLLAFLLYPNNLLRNIFDYALQLTNYQHYRAQGKLFPVNVSISNTVSLLSGFFWEKQFPSYYVTLVSLLILIISITSLILIGRRRPPIVNILLVTCLPILTPGVSFNYYLTLLLVPLLFIVKDFSVKYSKQTNSKSFEEINTGTNILFANRFHSILLSSSYILLFVPWSIPWFLVAPSIHGSRPMITSVNWAIGQLILLIYFCTLLIFKVDSPQRQSQDRK